ncbi:MarR family winged helix-turn-helix transcriptional regulator [Corynebacterium variabile]|uniref:MarR family winged helix-turn-helix transcriptional regulator n=1 Tax=Corynebacterium variabile TaxID=1727 RepID=UPI003FD54416
MNKETVEAARVLRYTILAVQRQGNRRLGDLLRGFSLTPSQAEAMEVLSEHGPMTTREVGSYLLCESGSPSRILAALAEKGLSVRSRPEGDRRATLHGLTRAGRDKLDQVRAAEEDFNHEFAESLETQFPADEELWSVIEKLKHMVTDPALQEALNLRFPDLKA